MGMFEWVIAVVCIGALAVGIMYGASYAASTGYANQTDTFGTAPTEQQNSTIAMVQTAGNGGTAISGGFAIFAAAIFCGICVFGGWLFLKRPRW